LRFARSSKFSKIHSAGFIRQLGMGVIQKRFQPLGATFWMCAVGYAGCRGVGGERSAIDLQEQADFAEQAWPPVTKTSAKSELKSGVSTRMSN
jgi:hypothetical protein